MNCEGARNSRLLLRLVEIEPHLRGNQSDAVLGNREPPLLARDQKLDPVEPAVEPFLNPVKAGVDVLRKTSKHLKNIAGALVTILLRHDRRLWLLLLDSFYHDF